MEASAGASFLPLPLMGRTVVQDGQVPASNVPTSSTDSVTQIMLSPRYMENTSSKINSARIRRSNSDGATKRNQVTSDSPPKIEALAKKISGSVKRPPSKKEKQTEEDKLENPLMAMIPRGSQREKIVGAANQRDRTLELEKGPWSIHHDVKVLKTLKKVKEQKHTSLERLIEITNKFWEKSLDVKPEINLLEIFQNILIAPEILYLATLQNKLYYQTHKRERSEQSTKLKSFFENLIGSDEENAKKEIPAKPGKLRKHFEEVLASGSEQTWKVNFYEFLQISTNIDQFTKAFKNFLLKIIPKDKKSLDLLNRWSLQKACGYKESARLTDFPSEMLLYNCLMTQICAMDVVRCIVPEERGALTSFTINNKNIFEKDNNLTKFDAIYKLLKEIYAAKFGVEFNRKYYSKTLVKRKTKESPKKGEEQALTWNFKKIKKEQARMVLIMGHPVDGKDFREELARLLDEKRVDWEAVQKLFVDRMHIKTVNWKQVAAEMALKKGAKDPSLELLHILVPAFRVLQLLSINAFITPATFWQFKFKEYCPEFLGSKALTTKETDYFHISEVSISGNNFSVINQIQIGLYLFREDKFDRVSRILADKRFATFFLSAKLKPRQFQSFFKARIIPEHLKISRLFIEYFKQEHGYEMTKMIKSLAGTGFFPTKISLE
jgi:hypothetical protein